MRGNIRDWHAALESRCDWGWLEGCFGPTISPTDIDFMVPFVVERHGQFLVGEIKRPDQEMPRGQMILLEALSRLPQFTVFILVGQIDDHEIDPCRMYLFQESKWQSSNRALFMRFCRDWYKVASGVWHEGYHDEAR